MCSCYHHAIIMIIAAILTVVPNRWQDDGEKLTTLTVVDTLHLASHHPLLVAAIYYHLYSYPCSVWRPH